MAALLVVAVCCLFSGCEQGVKLPIIQSNQVTHTYWVKPGESLLTKWGLRSSNVPTATTVVHAKIDGNREFSDKATDMVQTLVINAGHEVYLYRHDIVKRMYEEVGFYDIEISLIDTAPVAGTEKPDSLTPEQRELVNEAKRQAKVAADGHRQESFARFLRK
jgi:hypothetical protein